MNDWGSGGNGWGRAGGGGWGNNPWPPPAPPAPKPGVIPLRPLGVGEILDGAFTTLRRHWRTALGISLAVAVVTQTAQTVVTGLWFGDQSALAELGRQDTVSPQELLDALKEGLGALALIIPISLIGSIIAAAMLTVVVSRAVLGKPVSVADAWASTRAQLLGMTGLFLAIPVLITGAFAVGMLPGLLLIGAGAEAAGTAALLVGGAAGLAGAACLWIRYCLAAPALVLEKQGVKAAMGRSAKLVQGAWWRICGIQVLVIMIVFVAGAIVEMPAMAIKLILTGGPTADDATSWPSLIVNGIHATITSTLTLPITAGVTALLYMDQRIRRESLDIELARAAAEGQ
ncbi:glycerophosphoryl diester phosphodiesterase membrane domain-containing protein [Streptomyces cinnamoneus]|uniref:glycerophosphoryl diester phosphodiesterase membrane domain-containing protein n=1 Tax=Streptomyces cinnamoneus TaxID=53446 RepID=UPI003432A992